MLLVIAETKRQWQKSTKIRHAPNSFYYSVLAAIKQCNKLFLIQTTLMKVMTTVAYTNQSTDGYQLVRFR